MKNGMIWTNGSGATINGSYKALIEYMTPTGEWVALNTWTGVASILNNSSTVTLADVTMNTLSTATTYRITITVTIGGAKDVVVMDRAPISAK